MTTIKLKVDDQHLTIKEQPIVSSGGANETQVEFEFSSEWDNLAKTAVFVRDINIVSYSLVNNNIAIVPTQALNKSGVMYIGVFGCGTNTTYTSTLVKYYIEKGAIIEIDNPEQSVYEQILAKFQETQNTLNTNDIVDNLLSTSSDKVLSANQGSILKSMIDNIDTSNYLQKSSVVNHLTSTDTTKVLSAKQGQVLKSLIDEANKANNYQVVTIPTNWSLDSVTGYYITTVNVDGVNDMSTPIVSLMTKGKTKSITEERQKEFNKIVRVETYTSGLKFVADNATTIEIDVIVKGV